MATEFVERKRWLFLGLPFTFTKYIIKENLHIESGDDVLSEQDIFSLVSKNIYFHNTY